MKVKIKNSVTLVIFALMLALSAFALAGCDMESGSSKRHTVNYVLEQNEEIDKEYAPNKGFAYHGKTVQEPSEPRSASEARTFDGWYTDSAYTEKFSFDTPVNDDLTLYGRFVDATYTVKFVTDCDIDLPDLTVKHGERLAEIDMSSLVKEGHNLESWTKDAALNEYFSIEYEPITENLTLYAKWVKKYYIITVETNNGYSEYELFIKYQDLITPKAYPKAGYISDGWYTDKELTKAIDLTTYQVSESITIYQKWKEDLKGNYGLNLNAEGTAYEITKFSSDALLDERGFYVLPREYNSLPVTTIVSGAFEKQYAPFNYYIPDSITMIETDAFNDKTTTEGTTTFNRGTIHFQAKKSNIKMSSGYKHSNYFTGEHEECKCEVDGDFLIHKNGDRAQIMRFLGSQTTALIVPKMLGGLRASYIAPFTFADRITENIFLDNTDGAFSINDNAFKRDFGTSTKVHVKGTQVIGGDWKKISFGPNPYSVGVEQNCKCESKSQFLYYKNPQDEIMIEVCIDTASASITIPSVIDGFPVTKIGRQAFENCVNLETVVIPSSVKEIFSGAFWKCKKLKSVTLNEGLELIENQAFKGTAITQITIPSSVTKIDYNAFENCKQLESVTFNSGILEIQSQSFAGCSSLKSVILPDTLTYLGSAAFKNCTSLETVILSDALTNLINEVFSDCTSLKSLKLPKALTSLAFAAFKNCRMLTTVVLPDTLTTIGQSVFLNTNLLTLFIPKSVTEIGNNFVSGNINLKVIYCEAEKAPANWVNEWNKIVDWNQIQDKVFADVIWGHKPA